ncbi:MAG: hypothetical protein K8R73_14850 [Clostridiales bacterium]|nr:hypothetical protein [Clostridiales bacterium]MDW7660296.1 hypothetical protein [Bacillota bacterium]
MYKVSEVAEVIGVEKTEIFEKMITHKTLMDPNIHKKDGVTYFDERGLEILKTLFSKDISSSPGEFDNFKLEQQNDSIKKNRPLSKFERDRKILIDKMDILRNELMNLDMELKLKDEMILKYQVKVNEDIEALNRFQYALLKKIERIME